MTYAPTANMRAIIPPGQMQTHPERIIGAQRRSLEAGAIARAVLASPEQHEDDPTSLKFADRYRLIGALGAY